RRPAGRRPAEPDVVVPLHRHGGVCAMSPGLSLLVVLVGLVPACALLVPRLRPAALAVAPWAALPALLLALLAPPDLTLELPGVILGTRLGLDSTGQVFLSFTAL